VRANVTYFGPYNYPDDLSKIYGGIDLVWAQDLWQRGANSDWLLPNRIYEASWFGCPSLAVADTQTGRRVDTAGLGFTIETPTADKLIERLRGLSRAQIEAAAAKIMALSDNDFRLLPQDVATAMSGVISQKAHEHGAL
jgi:succinoglycan biosynthesis protein ExoL